MKKGDSAVHHRARALQGEARSGQGRGSGGGGGSTSRRRPHFERPAELIEKKVTTQATFDSALATRDSSQRSLDQARSNTRLAAINYEYAHVRAPFDGVVTARKVSVGTYVGGTATPTVLATIVQLDPI